MREARRAVRQRLAGAVLAIAFVLGAFAAVAANAEDEGGAFGVLRGRWVRPDGGYEITIRGADASGRLDASYANPQPLPFAQAEASRSGDAIALFFELRAGGYDGSTYTLRYDPAKDVLTGVYYQAVARQKFDVFFERAKP